MNTKEILSIPLYQKIAYILGGISFIILGACGYKMGNVFPYSILTGIVLLVVSLVISLAFDRSKWSGNRSDYPDDLGGSSGMSG